jgi:hypothetical protein
MWTSTADNVPSGDGVAVVPMKAPGVIAERLAADRAVMRASWATRTPTTCPESVL